MAEVGLDSVRDLSARERWGVTMELHRLAIVTGLDPASHDSGEEYEVLFDALDELGLPALGALSSDPNLILVERNPRLFDGENDKVEVELHYLHFSEAGTQALPVLGGTLYVRFATSTREVESNKDRAGDQILLHHKYDAADPERASLVSPHQGGMIRTYETVRTAIVDGLVDMNYATGGAVAIECQWIVDNIANRVNVDGNDNTWPIKGEEGLWRCSVADFVQLDRASSEKGRALFHFEFEYNPDGWQPEVAFIDDRTNKPPKGLYTEATYAAAGLDYPGIKTVTKYHTANYQQFFQQLSEYDPPD